MIGFIALALLALVGWKIYGIYQSFQRNLVEAKKSGIPYVCAPIYMHHPFWLIFNKLLRPQLAKLPKSWTSSWLPFTDPEYAFIQSYAPFAERDNDLLLIVTPQKLILSVADADAISQITQRRADFPKPTEVYRSLNIFGGNVVSSEGAYWRQHRKISAPSFGEKNNWLVWTEAIHQAEHLASAWLGNPNQTIQDATVLTMRLALHIICRAGFGVSMVWPEEEKKIRASGKEISGYTAINLPPGHTRSYKDAVEGLLEGLILNLLVPTWLLKRLPFAKTHEAYECRVEWEKYMNELYDEKLAEVQAGDAKSDSMDLLGSLIRGSGIAQRGQDGKTAAPLMSKNEIIANSFVFMLAGHETSSNAMGFSMLFLAMQPSIQRLLQEDIDRVLGDRDPKDWEYEEDFPKLFGSMPGAVMNETLRVLPSVTGIPKSANKSGPQPLTHGGGKRVVVPAGAIIHMNAVGLHRNPRYWPAYVDPITGKTSPNDLDEFKPERWLVSNNSTANGPHDAADEEQLDDGGPSGPDTSERLFKPRKGSYIPFSEGFRSCLGRRFAQVETLAALCYLFRYYSIELGVDADDAAVEKMSAAERQALWAKAKTRAEGLFKTHMESRVTLQMRDETVPLRLVKRGSERFLH